jgi:glycosyltransferase involved in cell wall biosynthesis
MRPAYKILISAYACSPYHGSEPGTGWNFVNTIARHHCVHVITEEDEFRADIEKYYVENPDSEKVIFHYIKRINYTRLTKLWPPAYYWSYKKWQQDAFEIAVELDKVYDFDLIHQLNQTGFREPGYLWKINKPFVWGPIGGTEITAWRFLPTMGLYGCIFFLFRNFINLFELNFAVRPRKAAIRKNNQLIAATPGTKLMIEKYWKMASTVIAEVGLIDSNYFRGIPNRLCNEPLKIIWSGEHEPRKGLNLLLRAASHLSIDNYVINVLGSGSKTKKWQSLARQLGLGGRIQWLGKIKRAEALKVMASGHVFCITSLHDLTSTVLLEALSLGLPVICLDHCGFADVVDDTCGIKIAVKTPSSAIRDMALALDWINQDEQIRQELANGALKRAADFNWDRKLEVIDKVYERLMAQNMMSGS